MRADIRDGVLGEAGVPGGEYPTFHAGGLEAATSMKSRCTFLEHLSSTLCVCVCVSVPLSVSLPIVAYLCTFDQGPVYLRCR